jgi:arsenite methyltransferase
MSTPNIKEVVREKYGQVARSVTSGAGNSCCGEASALQASCDPITSNLYNAAQEGEVPDSAIKASLGCGNPVALAELKPGETVLDLGSGGGIDVLLSARRVGDIRRDIAPTNPALHRGLRARPLRWRGAF